MAEVCEKALLTTAWLLGTGFIALASYASFDGTIDRHIWDVVPTKLVGDALNAWLGEALFVVAGCGVRVSVLLSYRRIAAGSYNPRWRLAVWAALSFTIGYTLALVLALVFNCTPTNAYWMSLDPEWKHEYHCRDTRSLNPIAGALSAVSDLYSVVLPMVMLRKLQITRRQKIGLNAIFGLGSLTIGCACARAYYLDQLGRDYDSTWLVKPLNELAAETKGTDLWQGRVLDLLLGDNGIRIGIDLRMRSLPACSLQEFPRQHSSKRSGKPEQPQTQQAWNELHAKRRRESFVRKSDV